MQVPVSGEACLTDVSFVTDPTDASTLKDAYWWDVPADEKATNFVWGHSYIFNMVFEPKDGYYFEYESCLPGEVVTRNSSLVISGCAFATVEVVDHRKRKQY